MFNPEELAAWQEFNHKMKRKFQVIYEGKEIILDTDVYFNRPVLGKILILPREDVPNFKYDKSWACISIHDPAHYPPKIPKDNCVDLLVMEFDDIEFEQPGEEGRGITSQQALEMLNFAQQHWHNIDLLLIHCNAGWSRSPAVGMILSEIYQPEYAEYFGQLFSPNKMVCEAMNEHRARNAG